MAHSAIARQSRPDRVLLIDRLTLWTSNLMLRAYDIDGACAKLIEALMRAQGRSFAELPLTFKP